MRKGTVNLGESCIESRTGVLFRMSRGSVWRGFIRVFIWGCKSGGFSVVVYDLYTVRIYLVVA